MKKYMFVFVMLIGFVFQGFSSVSDTITGHIMNAPSTGVLVKITMYDGYSLLPGTIVYEDSMITDVFGNYAIPYTIFTPPGGGLVEAEITDCNGNLVSDTASWDTLLLTRPIINLDYCLCTADFFDSVSISNPLEVYFTNNSLPAVGPISYNWDFGDFTISGDKNPRHVYASSGSYTICLTVVDSVTSCTSTYCDTLQVFQPIFPCEAKFNFTITGLTVSFQGDSSTVPSGDIDYNWSFNNVTDTNPNPTYTFSTSGVYRVCLMVSDSNCSDTAYKDVVVSNGLTLSGTVTANAGIPGQTEVYLISDSAGVLKVENSQLITEGNYLFPVTAGTYYVKSILHPSNTSYLAYLPTYYQNSFKWNTSTASIVTTQSISNVDIVLNEGVNPGGPALIRGKLTEGVNKIAAPGDPVEGAVIVLTDEVYGGVGHTITNVNGEYEFDNIAYGTYRVFADIVGKVAHERFIVLNENNEEEENADFIVNKNEIVTGTNEFITISLTGIYPNPVNQIVNVNLSASEQFSVKLVLTDLVGNQIMERDFSGSRGNQAIQLNVSELSSGIYLMHVISDRGTVNAKKLIKY